MTALLKTHQIMKKIFSITFFFILSFLQAKIQFKHLYSKSCLKRSLKKKAEIGFQDRLLLNAGQKYWRMLQEHSAILLTFIKLPFAINIFVLSILEWPPKTGFTVLATCSVNTHLQLSSLK